MPLLNDAADEAQAHRLLFLQYQPKIDLKSGRATGFEALLRWQHPPFGVIAPEEFVPIAEETGLIVGIGEWALRRAECGQIQEYYFSKPLRAADCAAWIRERVEQAA